MRRREFLSLLAGSAAAWPLAARAQAVNKIVRIIVGFPAGGGTDIVARILAEAMQGHYGSSIIVEDKPGASARLAIEYVRNSPADGSVLARRSARCKRNCRMNASRSIFNRSSTSRVSRTTGHIRKRRWCPWRVWPNGGAPAASICSSWC